MSKLKSVRRRRVKKGACVMNNGRAPRGWVEIQRDDDPSNAGIGNTVFECDEDAARAVAIAGGMPGTAFAFNEQAVFYPLELRGNTTEGWPIVVVPASVARAAGLVSRRRELEAYKGAT